MPFVKIDCGILNSSTWMDRPGLEIFLTALLLAEPHEITEPAPAIGPLDLLSGGYTVPPGWYGLARISPDALMEKAQRASDEPRELFDALMRLCSPDEYSRSQLHGGRRLVRIEGGFIVLNYDRYRQRDTTAKERMRRHRERQKQGLTGKSRRNSYDATRNASNRTRHVTQAEAEAEAEADIDISPVLDISSQAPASEVGTSQGNGSNRAPKVKRKKRENLSHFVPDEWCVSDDLAEWAMKRHPRVNLSAETKKFRSHEFAVPKSDFNRAWQNWIRRADELKH